MMSCKSWQENTCSCFARS